MAVTSDYIHGKRLTLTINGATVPAQVSSVDDEMEEVEVTNLKSNGSAEFIGGIKTVSLTCDCYMDANSLTTFTNGTPVAATYAVTGGHTYSGDFIPFKQSHKAGAKGAYMVNCAGKFTGSVSRS